MISLTSAQRHADADLVGALPGGVGHHAINSNARQNQRQQAERPREDHRDALEDAAHLHVRLESGHVEQRQIGD